MNSFLFLDLRFDEVFSTYTERFNKHKIEFKGELLQEYCGCANYDIARYVSGGRTFKEYEFNRCGSFISGFISYYPKGDLNPGRRGFFTHDDVRNIRMLVEGGMTQAEVGRRFGTSICAVNDVVRRRGRYNFE